MREKESQMQKLRLIHEQTQKQMHLYQSMKKRYEQQRRFFHDYKNQINCILEPDKLGSQCEMGCRKIDVFKLGRQ